MFPSPLGTFYFLIEREKLEAERKAFPSPLGTFYFLISDVTVKVDGGYSFRPLWGLSIF